MIYGWEPQVMRGRSTAVSLLDSRMPGQQELPEELLANVPTAVPIFGCHSQYI
jgi:hypothetical protein